MTEIDPNITIEDLEPDPGSGTTIRINPPSGDRRVHAFARLAVVVDRATSTEIPLHEVPASAARIQVHARPPEPTGAISRLRHEASEALALAEVEHAAALADSHDRWQAVHEQEQRMAEIVEEEAAALRAFELIRDTRRNADRALRQARNEGEAASRRCLITSRILEESRIRADRL
ncbi:MAG: hypothetical protein ACXVKN_08780 [Acidimicrobiia bacterium]